MTAFVTGATGFIGRRLAERLAGEGRRVVCLVRNPDKAGWMRQIAGVEPLAGDLSDPDALRRGVREARWVFHVAGLTRARNRAEYFSANALGTENLARAVAASARRLERAVYVSSLAVAGPRPSTRPAREDDPPAPITWYGESKLEGERRFVEICRDLPWAVVRPPVVYGPRDRGVYVYVRAAAAGIVPLLGGGRLELSLIHVDDLAEALLLAAVSPAAVGRTYYVSDGEAHSIRELAAHLREIFGKGTTVSVPAWVLKAAGAIGDAAGAVSGRTPFVNRMKVREALQDGWVCAIDRIRGELGFVPRIGLAAGLAATVSWYRENGWL